MINHLEPAEKLLANNLLFLFSRFPPVRPGGERLGIKGKTKKHHLGVMQ